MTYLCLELDKALAALSSHPIPPSKLTGDIMSSFKGLVTLGLTEWESGFFILKCQIGISAQCSLL